MGLCRHLASIESIAPSNPNIPVLNDQREELRSDRGHNIEVVEIILDLIEWRFIDVRTTEHISDTKAGTIPEIIDRVDPLPSHSE